MELEILIAKANKRGIGTEEFIKRLQGKCVTYIQTGRLDDLEALIPLVGKLPEFEPEIIQEAFQKYLVGKRFDDAKRLSGLIGINPAEWVIQGAFKSYLINLNLTAVEKLTSTFGIKPSEEAVQAAYLQLVEKATSKDNIFREHFKSLLSLKKMTGFEPSDEVAIRLYNKPFVEPVYGRQYSPTSLLGHLQISPNEGELDALGNMIKETGVRPPYGEVQRLFKVMMEYAQMDLIASLKEISGYDVSEETQKEGLKSLLLKENLHAYGILRDQGWSEPGPEAIQGVYLSYAKNGKVGLLKNLETMTGLEPNGVAHEALLDWLMSSAPKASGGGDLVG